MVHALEKTHTLLKRNGRLLDIHPHPDEPEIVVRRGEQTIRAGWLYETDDRVEYGQADEALTAVVRAGLFAVEQQETFLFNTYADNLTELQTFLAETWQDAVIDALTAMRIEDLLNTPEPDSEIILREWVRIGRLRPLTSQHLPQTLSEITD